MKSSLRAIILGGFAAALLTLSFYATSFAAPFNFGTDITLNSHTVQVVHGSTYISDSTSMTLDITNDDGGSCGSGDDLISSGLQVIALYGKSCSDFANKCNLGGCPTPPFDDSTQQ